MTTLTRLATVAAATLLAVTVLSGCAPTSGFDPGALGSTTAKPTAGATPTPKGPTADSVTVGQTLTAADTHALRKIYNDLIDAGKVLYSMPDGSSVVVGLKEAVPAVVVADASAKITAAAVKSAAEQDGNSGVGAAIKIASAAVGHKVVNVVWASSANRAGTRYELQWLVLAPSANAEPQRASSREAGLVLAQAFVAKQADPAAWTVLG